jgi:glycosyltransferase involved in cell wall biosynthesis
MVTVASPLCTARERWFPTLYEMFAHQDYPGKIELLLIDGKCAKMPEKFWPSKFFQEKQTQDNRVRYNFLDGSSLGPANMTLGAKRNWLALNAKGEIIITMDVDDYYGPRYVSAIVREFLKSGADFVKLHAWFSLGERWLYDPLRRLYDWTYIDMEKDPLPWGWTYNYRKKLFSEEGHRFGDVDASEEGGFFKTVTRDRIFTFPDLEYLAIRIVSRFVGRMTGARKCDYCGPGLSSCSRVALCSPFSLMSSFLFFLLRR